MWRRYVGVHLSPFIAVNSQDDCERLTWRNLMHKYGELFAPRVVSSRLDKQLLYQATKQRRGEQKWLKFQVPRRHLTDLHEPPQHDTNHDNSVLISPAEK